VEGALGAVLAYHRLLEADPAGALEQAQELAEKFSRTGITFAGAPMASFLRPHFVERGAWESLRTSGRRLLELAARVGRRAFGGDVGRLCAFLGTPAGEVPWVALDPGEPDVVLSRLDAFLTPTGPRFIEINSDAPAGFGYGDRMARAFSGLRVFQEFVRRHPVSYHSSEEGLVKAVRGAAPGGDPPTVAIVDWKEVKTRADQEILREAFLAWGLPCFLADPREMELRGGRLRAGGKPVGIVYRRAVLSELVAREDEVGEFLRAYREGVVPFVNSFRCRLSEDKAFLAILTDEAFASLLSEDERAFVAQVAPWTRKVEERRTRRAGREIDLLPHAMENRRGLVLKPAHGYGGQSVLVGEETEPGRWERALREALREPWVVQERVAIPEEAFPVIEGGSLAFEPLKINTNPFYVPGEGVGAVTRVSRSAVINVSAGGGSVPVFVLDGPRIHSI
jgi:uncharacterized circularly permuted ATP-grasp superfamily protein